MEQPDFPSFSALTTRVPTTSIECWSVFGGRRFRFNTGELLLIDNASNEPLPIDSTSAGTRTVGTSERTNSV